jgi:hypothetical protein
MNAHHLAQASHRKFALYFLNEGVLYPDVLAKYTAAFFKMSRSSVTRFNSAFSRRISSDWASWALRSTSGTPNRFVHE